MKACSGLCLLSLILWVIGCSSTPPVLQYDSPRAVEALVAALDAWKAGEVDSLATREPPIRFEDEDCRSGLRLMAYRLEPRTTPIQPFDDVTVFLSLCDQRGENFERAVVYQVALEPHLAVLRSD